METYAELKQRLDPDFTKHHSCIIIQTAKILNQADMKNPLDFTQMELNWNMVTFGKQLRMIEKAENLRKEFSL